MLSGIIVSSTTLIPLILSQYEQIIKIPYEVIGSNMNLWKSENFDPKEMIRLCSK